MCYGIDLLHCYGHDAPPVVIASWQHHSGEQAQTIAGSHPSKNRLVQPSPLNMGFMGCSSEARVKFGRNSTTEKSETFA
jgi:hypothetical protein